MDIIIRQAKILDPTSDYHQKTCDIKIRDGRITRIADQIKGGGDEIIEGEELVVAPGFFDVGTQGGEPGLEHREDWDSLAAAAAAGGYTGLAIFPNTLPVIDNKSAVSYIRQHSGRNGVAFHAIGAVSQGGEGQQLAELYDMERHGAIAFSDGRNAIHNGSLLLKALEYVKTFEGWIINRPEDGPLRGKGQMHEGAMSTSLGLTGIPSLAEVSALQRDIELLRYAGSRLIVHGLSAGESLRHVAQAKSEGLQILASTPVMNLVFDDQTLLHFDANYKVMPPLRTERDREALIEGLKNGTIDFIVSNHEPLDVESVEKEFPYAEFGAVTLPTTFALLNTHLKGKLRLPQIIRLLSEAPRIALGLPVPSISTGEVAELVVIDPKANHIPTRENQQSKGVNDPFIGMPLKGRILATVLADSLQRQTTVTAG